MTILGGTEIGDIRTKIFAVPAKGDIRTKFVIPAKAGTHFAPTNRRRGPAGPHML